MTAPLSARSFSQLLDELQQTRDSIARSMAGALEETTSQGDGAYEGQMPGVSVRGADQRGALYVRVRDVGADVDAPTSRTGYSSCVATLEAEVRRLDVFDAGEARAKEATADDVWTERRWEGEAGAATCEGTPPP